MTRFAWREFRTQAIVAACAVVISAAILGITGANLAHLYDTTVANCKVNSDCSSAISVFLSTDNQLRTALDILIVVLPGFLGVFWGAPLIAREFETGTHRLAWTQSVTRARWLLVKVGVAGGCSLLVTGLISLMVTWWFSPVDRVNMNAFASFEQRDIVPIGYAAFAFALGVVSGVVLRRTLPAMATTLAGFVLVRLVVAELVRPNLAAPLHATVPNTTLASLVSIGSSHSSLSPSDLTPGQGALPPNAWLISDQTINSAGRVIGENGFVGGGITLIPGVGGHGLTIQGAGTCPGINVPPLPSGALIEKCIDRFHIRDVLTYQPGSHYWPFQWGELAIFLVLSLILIGLSLWFVQRRAA